MFCFVCGEGGGGHLLVRGGGREGVFVYLWCGAARSGLVG